MIEFARDLFFVLMITLIFLPLIGILFIRFRIENKSITIINFGIISYAVKLIAINEIAEIKLIPTWKILHLLFIPYLSFGFRWWNNNAILIRTHTGLLRLTFLAPADPEAFLKKIQKEINR